MFEGEYPNGKGKEYFNKETIKFEGDYINGIKWNGIGYDQDLKVIYKLKNGRGYIKELNNFGSLIFEGEYIYGKKTGYGKEYKDNKIIFEGIYLNNIRKRGKSYIDDILEFEGKYLFNEKWNGKIYDIKGNAICELNNGLSEIKEKYGKRKEYDKDGKLIFEVEYINGIMNGKGKEYKNCKLIFEGEYLDGKRWNGKGKEYHLQQDKLIFEGEYKNGMRWNGKVKEYYDNGKLEFVGQYLNGERNGKGREYEFDILVFQGEYLN